MIAESVGLLRGDVSSRVSLVVPDDGCGREVLGRVSLRVSFGMFRGCGWGVSWRMLLAVGSVDGGV